MAKRKPSQKPAPKRARILLVDDHPMVRERLREVIGRESDLMVCGEAEDRHEALEAIKITKPDLVMIDLTLKSSHGLELVKDIHQQYPKLFMLVVSMHDESLHAERTIRAGAHGYITKQEATKKILLAIRRVLGGEVYLNEKIAGQVVAKATNHQTLTTLTQPLDRLSDRELRVFELTGQGQSIHQIAGALHLEVKTVESYRARIKQKLNLKNAAELLQFAIRWSQSP
jgi:DNA-binding NarL/FixJ family response regulator